MADEVSKLADQTAMSLKEIDWLISKNSMAISKGKTTLFIDWMNAFNIQFVDMRP